MIITRPLRRMTLHFSHMGLTDGLTFMTQTSLSTLKQYKTNIRYARTLKYYTKNSLHFKRVFDFFFGFFISSKTGR